MAQVLYRKYRSQTFDELIGQEHITKILRNAVKTGKISHAFLFVGSRGTGKTSTARILAKAINCKNPSSDGNPCNQCENCKAITAGTFLDLIEIDAASNRGIDQIRDLKEKIEFSPTEGKFKIYIIDEVHMLTNEAFNALLKTLEEPPAHAIFMLATTEVHKLPPTIISRCQRYDFRLGDENAINKLIRDAAKAEGVKLTDGSVKLLVENARGSYRDALSLLDVVVSGQLPDKEVTEDEVRGILGIPDNTMVYYFLEKLVYNDGASAVKLIKELDSKGVNLTQFIKYSLSMLREILVTKIGDSFDPNEYSFAKQLTQKDIVEMINVFLQAEKQIKTLSFPALALEMIIPQVNFELSGDCITKPRSDQSSDGKGSDTKNSKNNHGSNPDKYPKNPDQSAKLVEDNKGESSDIVLSENVGNIKETTGVSQDDEELSKAEQTVSQANDKNTDLKQSVSHESVEKNESIEAVSQLTDDTMVKSKAESIEISAEKSETVTKKGATKNTRSSIDLATIEKKWDEVTDEIRGANGHLYGFLGMAKLIDYKDSTLEMEVPFEFHKERIECIKSREAIMSVFEKIFGTKFGYKCIVNQNMSKRKQVTADIVAQPVYVEEVITKSSGGNDNKEPINSRAGSYSGGANLASNASTSGNGGGSKGFRRGLGKEVEEIFAGL